MQPRFLSSLLASSLLLTTACAADVDSVPIDRARRTVTISGALPADLQEVMSVCTSLTLVPGQDDLIGRRDLLSLCTSPDGSIDFRTVQAGASSPARALRLSAMAGGIDQVESAFDAPLPSSLGSTSIPVTTVQPFAWVLPLVEGSLESAPASIRQAALQTVAALLASGSCRLTGSVTTSFRRAPLEHIGLSFSDAGGTAHVRLAADVDPDRNVASYRIQSAFTCGGSTANPVHQLLQEILPNRTHFVRVPDGSIRVRTFLVPAGAAVDGIVEATVDIDEIQIDSPVDWLHPAVFAMVLEAVGITAESVEEDLEPQVEDALGGLGPQIGTVVTESLDLSSDERVTSIGVDAGDLVVNVRNPRCRVLGGQVICLPPL